MTVVISTPQSHEVVVCVCVLKAKDIRLTSQLTLIERVPWRLVWREPWVCVVQADNLHSQVSALPSFPFLNVCVMRTLATRSPLLAVRLTVGYRGRWSDLLEPCCVSLSGTSVCVMLAILFHVSLSSQLINIGA